MLSWMRGDVAVWPCTIVMRSRRRMARKRGKNAKYVGSVAWSTIATTGM